MKIALIAPTYIPARRANTIQVMKMAQAFSALGHTVVVLVPGKAPQDGGHWPALARHYGLQHTFELQWLPIHPQLRGYDYALAAVRRAQAWKANLLYTRLPQAAALASFLRIPIIYEIHDFPQGKLAPWLLTRFLRGRGARALVMITAALKEALTPRFLPPKNLPAIVVPDGVDITRYQNLPDPTQARHLLSSNLPLPPSAFVAGYTGHLYPGRGAEHILEMAAHLPAMRFVLAGGEPVDVARLREVVNRRGLANVILTGFIPNADLPGYQAACDVLLMPYQRRVAASSGGDIARYLSPMKLFEYLACGRAILSSDLPVLQEVLNPQNAVLLPADEVAVWVAALQDLQTHPERRATLAAQARKDAQQYSWEARAHKILQALADD